MSSVRIPWLVLIVLVVVIGTSFAFLITRPRVAGGTYDAYWFAMHHSFHEDGIPLGAFPSFDETTVHLTSDRGRGVVEAYKVSGVLRLPEGKAAQWSCIVECGDWQCREVAYHPLAP